MSLGFRSKWFRRLKIAGKTSELCLIGPVKAVSASIHRPVAIATEPILPDVSTANIKGFCAIIFLNCCIFFSFLLLFRRKPHCTNKKAFFLFTIFTNFPNYAY